MADAGNTPQLVGFGLANYRSFGPDGFLLTSPRKVNVLVGKNNSGKSNVLRSIQALPQLTSPKAGVKLFSAMTDKFQRGESQVEATVVLPLGPLIPDEHRRSRTASGVLGRTGPNITVRWNTVTGELLRVREFEMLGVPDLGWLIRQLAQTDFHDTLDDRKRYLLPLREPLFRAAMGALQSAFGELLVVPVFREIKPDADQPSGSYEFSGRNIIRALREMQVPLLGDEAKRLVFDRIQQFTRDLVGVPALELQVPQEDRLYIKMNGPRLPLENFGTGIHHLVILCAALAMHSGRVVTIEEPEIHLHPDLQRKFLRFIAEQTENTYYITTHSNVFLDARPDVNVYHVLFDGERSTLVHAETTARSREVLTDMGYKASDLLQSNCVVWLEGPSDRVFLNKWLSLVAPDLVEGIHYAVAFYGGKVLAHFTAADDPADDLVQVLRINKHALVVVDRDGDNETALLNRSKDRIRGELGLDACWVTQGREIENYITVDLVRRALKGQYPAVEQVEFGLNDSLDEVLQEMEGGPSRYEKVPFARFFCASMTASDLDVLDLRERLAVVVRLIRRWNHESEAVDEAVS